MSGDHLNDDTIDKAFYESAYGDFEELVNQRRSLEILGMPVAMADEAASKYDVYTDIEGVTVGKNFENREIREQLKESQKTMGDMQKKFAA